jgi:HlyD family secretion protein
VILMKRPSVRLTLIVFVIVAVLVWAFWPSPVPVDFATVESGPLQVTIDDEGETRVRDKFVVSAPLPGRMRRIELEPGDAVSGNTVVALFEPADPALLDVRTRSEIQARVRAAEASVGAARADRERVRSDLNFARADLKRYRELAEAAIASRERLDAAERQVTNLEEGARSADFSVRAAEHQLEVARAALVQTRGGRGVAIRLMSPIDGVVLKRLQESEAVVPTGQPLLEIGDVARLEIVSDLLSTAAVRVRPGQKVLIEQWGGEKPLIGRIRRVEPSGFTKISALGVEEQRVNVVIDLEAPRGEWQSLGDGYRVEVRIVVWEKDRVVKVPTSSLFRHDGKWAVFRVENERAVRRIVDIGQRSGLEAEVLSGVQAGDRIIVYPSDQVTDGVRVVARQI